MKAIQTYFSTASEIEEPVDLSKVDAIPEVEGWRLELQTPDRLMWGTPSGYAIQIQGQRLTVRTILPPEAGEERRKENTMKVSRTLQEEFEDPNEAVGYAIGWIEKYPVNFERDLTNFPGIGDRTAEYLLFVHDIRTHQQLYELYKKTGLDDVVGEQFREELREAMKDQFGIQ